jgi:hypothetical protein
VSYYIGLVLSVRTSPVSPWQPTAHPCTQELGIVDPTVKTTVNGSLQIFNLVMAFGMSNPSGVYLIPLTANRFVGAALLVEKIGRRRLFLISNTGMFFSFAVWTVFVALFTELGYKWTGKCIISQVKHDVFND